MGIWISDFHRMSSGKSKREGKGIRKERSSKDAVARSLLPEVQLRDLQQHTWSMSEMQNVEVHSRTTKSESALREYEEHW